ncbi:hypothetical protein PAXRUDRAFT_832857 [Paxillus rubicundulus Ve08.2h10]|uniref:Uncharacterized protein n=1 Tax=Paxillus rubicundulus Ve08.2h10 TaxID=930991 RepID=A0A0D0DQ93_9AGAM|nr:hypothetical protein PAXRUDRAFT_832857 [Paxillus rubicundulus Ve08.2h10]
MVPTSPTFSFDPTSRRGDFYRAAIREMENAIRNYPSDDQPSQSFEHNNTYPTFAANNNYDSMTIYQPQPLYGMRPHSAPSTPIAYTTLANAPNAALNNSASVLSAVGYHVGPQPSTPYNCAPAAHTYHPPRYRHQPNDEPARYPVTMEEPIPRPGTVRERMLQTAARPPCVPSTTLNPKVPHYPHPQAFANSLRDQGIVGQDGYVTGPGIQKYTPLSPHKSTSAPHYGFADGTSMSFHPTPAYVAPGYSPTSSVAFDTTHVCQCVGGDSPCCTLLTGNTKELRDHLASDHHFRATGKKYHKCLWMGCVTRLQRENIPRHMISTHLRVKVRCETCNVELSRSDVRHSHAKRCPARLPV